MIGWNSTFTVSSSKDLMTKTTNFILSLRILVLGSLDKLLQIRSNSKSSLSLKTLLSSLSLRVRFRLLTQMEKVKITMEEACKTLLKFHRWVEYKTIKLHLQSFQIEIMIPSRLMPKKVRTISTVTWFPHPRMKSRSKVNTFLVSSARCSRSKKKLTITSKSDSIWSKKQSRGSSN